MPNRMKREEFFDRVSGFNRDQLLKVLWTLYWRGSAAVRERIETELYTVEHGGRRPPVTTPPVNPAATRDEVERFVQLAYAGAYMGGDRRVSPRERTRWRFTFRRLATEAERGFRDAEAADAIAAAEELINLACQLRDFDFFRSEDPVEAARFVVSDAVAVMWAAVRDRDGFDEFARRASAQLIRWESEFGWTRHGWGKVSQKETSLAQVLVGMLRVPEAWARFAEAYLDALENAAHTQSGKIRGRKARTEDLAEWHQLLIDRLFGGDSEDLLDRIAQHPALGGPELQYFQAQLARRRGHLDQARDLVKQSLQALPGHADFLRFAIDIDAELPPRARQAAAERGLG